MSKSVSNLKDLRVRLNAMTRSLAGVTICERCGATLEDAPSLCRAGHADPCCPGYGRLMAELDRHLTVGVAA